MENPMRGSSLEGKAGRDPNRTRRWDPEVFAEDWYFVDETGTALNGPYGTKMEADDALTAYARTI